MGTLVIGLGGSLFSDYKAVICSPRNGLVPVLAVMVGCIHISFDSVYSIAAEGTIIAATMLTDLFLLLPGRLKRGNLVRYIPYPVIGVFLQELDIFFVQGSLTAAAGVQPTFGSLVDAQFIRLIILAVVLALCLIMGGMLKDNGFSVPGILLLAISLFYGVLLLAGIPQEQAIDNGLLPKIEETGPLFSVFKREYFSQINWIVTADQIGGIVLVSLLCSMMLLLDVSGIEFLIDWV